MEARRGARLGTAFERYQKACPRDGRNWHLIHQLLFTEGIAD
jgi:hypothetical protein